jgi:hypothetical protein
VETMQVPENEEPANTQNQLTLQALRSTHLQPGLQAVGVCVELLVSFITWTPY